MKQNKDDLPKIDKGVFTFLAKHNLNISEKRRILYLFGKSKGLERPKKTSSRHQWYADVSLIAQEDFKEFKKSFNKNKPTLKRNRQSYDDWWDECNTDGTFAYSGVTDDF